MEVALINPIEYGIEEKKAVELLGNLPQLRLERDLLSKQYEEIVLLDIEEPTTAFKAKELRLRIRDNRTKGIGPWHKNAKDYFLNGGRFVDAINRMEIAINERMEANLELIEKHQELKELKRRDDLRASRLIELKEYMEFVPNVDLGQISEEEYLKIFNGAKMQFDFKVKEELRLEEERLENERILKLHLTRLNELRPYEFFVDNIVDINTTDFGRMEEDSFNDILSKLIDAKKTYEINQEKIRVENERLKKEAEKREQELEIERRRAKEEADKLEAKRQKEIKEEREKQAKLESELKAIKEAEAKAQKEKIEAEKIAKKEAERLAKAPIKEKLTLWVNSFEIPKIDVQNEATDEINEKFIAFKSWANLVIEKL